MRSQDIFILLKLESLREQELEQEESVKTLNIQRYTSDWEGWDPEEKTSKEKKHVIELDFAECYTVRGLAASLGVSKSEVSSSLKRSISSGLAVNDRMTNFPKANTRALLDFIYYGLKYVFPVRPGEIVRGIPTSFAAPVLEGEIMTAGEFIYVWPDARGKRKGQHIPPLFKTVPYAVKKDRSLYELLALVDAIRLGTIRESKIAKQRLEERLKNR